ncbi:hypothetical protein [Actinocorallia herbida]|uniref:hypothetical protein n=1 Tax=Actinocorallia herbida TaxID=58109 RepID=UPI001476C01A|nr:hypothetical protein [Actinocorallia herbida]
MIAAVITQDPTPPARSGPVLGPLLLTLMSRDPARRPAYAAIRDHLTQAAS